MSAKFSSKNFFLEQSSYKSSTYLKAGIKSKKHKPSTKKPRPRTLSKERGKKDGSKNVSIFGRELKKLKRQQMNPKRLNKILEKKSIRSHKMSLKTSLTQHRNSAKRSYKIKEKEEYEESPSRKKLNKIIENKFMKAEMKNYVFPREGSKILKELSLSRTSLKSLEDVYKYNLNDQNRRKEPKKKRKRQSLKRSDKSKSRKSHHSGRQTFSANSGLKEMNTMRNGRKSRKVYFSQEARKKNCRRKHKVSSMESMKKFQKGRQKDKNIFKKLMMKTQEKIKGDKNKEGGSRSRSKKKGGIRKKLLMNQKRFDKKLKKSKKVIRASHHNSRMRDSSRFGNSVNSSYGSKFRFRNSSNSYSRIRNSKQASVDTKKSLGSNKEGFYKKKKDILGYLANKKLKKDTMDLMMYSAPNNINHIKNRLRKHQASPYTSKQSINPSRMTNHNKTQVNIDKYEVNNNMKNYGLKSSNGVEMLRGNRNVKSLRDRILGLGHAENQHVKVDKNKRSGGYLCFASRNERKPVSVRNILEKKLKNLNRVNNNPSSKTNSLRSKLNARLLKSENRSLNLLKKSKMNEKYFRNPKFKQSPKFLKTVKKSRKVPYSNSSGRLLDSGNLTKKKKPARRRRLASEKSSLAKLRGSSKSNYRSRQVRQRTTLDGYSKLVKSYRYSKGNGSMDRINSSKSRSRKRLLKKKKKDMVLNVTDKLVVKKNFRTFV